MASADHQELGFNGGQGCRIEPIDVEITGHAASHEWDRRRDAGGWGLSDEK